MIRNIINFFLILICGCSAHAAQVAGGPVLTISAPPGVMLQDSADLSTWQDIAVATQLTVLASGPAMFYRGVAQPTILLSWSAAPGATGYKIYWGKASTVYRHCLPVGPDTLVALTVADAQAVIYAAVTAVNGAEESDFSNERCFSVSPPALTIH